MKNLRTIPDTFLKYKTLPLNPKLLKFLSTRHNTKTGTWGEIVLSAGSAQFEFLAAGDQVLLREEVETDKPFIVPPAVWHRLLPQGDEIAGCVSFYCHPAAFFQKKYKLSKPHSDVVSLNNNYLKTLFSTSKSLDIFDMGCGRGRNSLYLSQFSHQLNSVDIDPKQISTLAHIIAEEGISNINVVQMDLESPQIDKSFDVFLFSVVLQFLAKDKVWPLLQLAQENTNIGGLHSIVCPMTTPGIDWPAHFSFSLETDQLRDFYLDQGWAILEYNEDFGNLHRLDENGLPLRGRFCSMIAQKIA